MLVGGTPKRGEAIQTFRLEQHAFNDLITMVLQMEIEYADGGSELRGQHNTGMEKKRCGYIALNYVIV